MNVIIGQKTGYDTDTKQIKLGMAYWQVDLLQETPIESVLTHESIHQILHRLFGEKVCSEFDNICSEIPLKFWIESDVSFNEGKP